jgi:diguanylate cyclase (GGDEF)-like protein/PAS domain S-box-containing protein
MRTPRQLVRALLAEQQDRTWRRQHLWAIYIVGMVALGISYMVGALVLALVAAAGGTFFLFVVAPLIRKQEKNEARFSSLVRHSSDIVALLGADMTIRYISPSVEDVLGYESGQLVGTRFSDLVRPEHVPRSLDFLLQEDDQPACGPLRIEFSLRHSSGGWLEVETMRTNLLADPNVAGIVLNARDITERKAFEQQLEHHAFYDSVTDLANRSLFRDRVNHALASAKRSHHSVAAMFMDLDEFKVVNDSYGHATGDALLRAVASRLSSCVRGGDTVARLGGDEFAVLLEDATEVSPAEVGERIMRALEAPFRVEHRELHIRASIGIAFANGKEGEAATDELLRNADVAMYVAKKQGKGRCEVYKPSAHKTVMRQLELKTEIQGALDKGEFILHYQPLVTLETELISGLEALVRWEHPTRGTIPPLEFIPLAEESGLIIPLGRWVLRTACIEAQRLHERYPHDPPLTMAVNLSARQLQSPTLITDVKEALRDSGLSPSSLTLEVTESAMMQNIELSVLRLEELRALHVRIAIDDFGAGYSSLGYIRRFPVDILKVDKSFIDRIDKGDEELALAAAIIDMARVLNLSPVAEGVERVEQFERLLELGCDLAQGYFFAKPAAQDVVEGQISGERHHSPPALRVVTESATAA